MIRLLAFRIQGSKAAKVATIIRVPKRVMLMSHLRLRSVIATAYLRAAHAYILISMPTGTSTIFGVFQAISALLLKRDELRPHEIN
jgi:hypothetical protein